MKRVSYPIVQTNSGQAVADLHAVLELLGYAIPPDEKRNEQFGQRTLEAVLKFQTDNALPPTRKIDAVTASALNKLANDAEIVKELKGHGEKIDRIEIVLDPKDGIPPVVKSHTAQLGEIAKTLDPKDGIPPVVKSHTAQLGEIAKTLDPQDGIPPVVKSHTAQLGEIAKTLDPGNGIPFTLSQHTSSLADFGSELAKHAERIDDMNSKLGESHVVSGHVQWEGEDAQPYSNAVVRAFHVGTSDGRRAFRLGEDTTDAEGEYTIRYSTLPGVSAINLLVVALGANGKTVKQSDVWLDVSASKTINLSVPITTPPPARHRVEGRIILKHGLPADRLKLRLYGRHFGESFAQLDEKTTVADGQYEFTYDPGDKALILEVRAVVGSDETKLSKPLNDLSREPHAVLNLVAPDTIHPPDSEYTRLSNALIQHIKQMPDLAKATESDTQPDITELNRATGWDARLIALAAISERLSAKAGMPLSQEAVYGLLRAGLPSDKLMLAQVDADVAEQVLKTVRDAGIVKLDDKQIADFKMQFATFASTVRLDILVPGSRSTYGALLKTSGLPQDAQNKFIPIYLNHRGDAAELWEAARKPGADGKPILAEPEIAKLQLHGKLAFLAGNSEGMTARLMQKPINDPVQLVRLGFHRPDQWKTEANALANNDEQQLEALLPAAYTGGKVQDRLDAYAEDMARKVRLSYPTQVVGQLFETDDRFKRLDVHPDTIKLLQNAAGQGFRLGETPVATFLKTHSGVQASEAAQKQLQTLQRIYQITPSNEAMPVLMSLGMTSAYDVMAYSEVEFAALYDDKYFEIYHKAPPQGEARLVSGKAKQVSSVTYNLFTIARKLDSEPPVAGMSAPVEVRESVRNELIKQFPTMESLFGSMDFCECEHCRSVLSPAAYLVDLLQFIDAEPAVWDNFLDTWSKNHDGRAYTGPYTLDGQQFTGKYKKPYDALIERRPDLPHIPLTCENTHTALPYIDVVNEILEYYVANGKLEEEAAHDTGEATTVELLAEPQNVIRGAYDKLREARYPLNLPFDLWIETVRQFCNYFETPLARVLEVFRPNDDLFATAQPFDRSTIFMESLGISPAELAIFTDTDPLGNDKWHKLYGSFPTVRPAIQNPTNVGHASLTVANADAKEFREGLACAYFDVSANALSAESKTISTIGDSAPSGTGQSLITFAGVWTTPPDAGDLLVCNVSATLSSAKTLSRRLGVTYKEIAEIVQTGFVNPELAKLAILYKLGVTIQDARRYKDHKPFYEQNEDLIGKERSGLSPADQLRFDALSSKVPNTQRTGWEIVNEVAAFELRIEDLAIAFNTQLNDLQTYVQKLLFDNILVLADPEAGCNFDLTTLRYANGDPADAIVFLRINLFVRLWRKLGWSIEETDRALCTFVPENAPFDKDPINLGKQPLRTALIYLAHLKALDEKLRVGKQNRIKLITLWSDITTTGKQPLYAQLFLTRSVLKSDPVFDHPLGQYLATDGVAAVAQSRKHRVQLEGVVLADKIDPAPFVAAEPKVELFYDELQEVQHLSFEGVLSDPEKVVLSALSPSPALPSLLDAVQVKAQEFSLVKGHLLTLQGALGLTTGEIRSILEDKGVSFDAARLSLPNVSLLYRYGLLAKALKLSVRELIGLKQLSGLDPFIQLHPEPLADTPAGVLTPKKAIDFDYPFSQTLRFVKVVEEVKDSGLKIDDLEYLLRHRFDEIGKYRPNPEGTLVLLKTLAEGVRAIRTEHAVPEDPGAMSEEVLQQKLGLALPPGVAERFLAMMNGTAEFTATKAGVQSADQLNPAAFADEPSIRQVSYNATRQEQKLTFRGVLFDAQKNDLKGRLPKPVPPAPHVPSPILDTLFDDVQQQAQAFFKKHLQKQAPNVQPTGGFLDEKTDFELLFNPNLALAVGETEHDRARNRRTKLAKAFMPFLQQRLICMFIVQTMTAHTGADPVLAESLLTDERLLAAPKPLLAAPKPLLDAFAAASERGITATYWFSADQSGVALTTQVRPGDASSLARVSSPVRSAGTASAGIDGYLEAPTDDDYEFSVVLAKKDDTAELRIGDTQNIVVATQDGEEFFAPSVELIKGKRYQVQLVVKGHGARQVNLLAKSVTLPKATYNCCRLDGYLEVPTPGAYRFYVELDEQNAEAELRFSHQAEPLLGPTAASKKDNYLELKAGVPYRFSLDLKKLNDGEARLLVQGETLPKGPLSQLALYPAAAIDAAENAVTLLNKALQLVQSLGLSEREIRYLLTHADKFDGLSLKTLPVRDGQHALNAIAAGKMEADNSLSKEQAVLQARDENPELAGEADQVTTHFKQFLRLAAYARLKRDLAGGTDDLIGIFEANATTAADKLDKQVYPLLAKVTRRDEATVKVTAAALFEISPGPVFESEKRLWRLWEALQIVERFGVPPASLLGWTGIVNSTATADHRFEIARDLKEAIKARFEPETWQRVAQPIFDKLRQRQRDALVSHVMHQHGFERIEQVYEYFLIDPGMEPVVQTSRIRLAIASLQLFIQRCLLNMESQVHPSVINSKQWEWMKRYRVWEANRKIFLFPENWLEPEFRDDKTHLFAELEGTLLQGDVSSDLVEDAFLNYLKRLDELARLDIVAMHLEDNQDPAMRTLHVIGRTYSQPHKYFYRRYANQMWTPWEPVTAEIEGDHLAPVVWRDRLHLFWVTLMDKADPNPPTGSSAGKLADVTLSAVMTDLKAVVAKKQVDVQLHWSEYLQGEWTTRESSGFSTISKLVDNQFDPRSVFVHVSKAYEADEERGVFIHLGGKINQAFHLAGRNSAPQQASCAAEPRNPYNSADTKLAGRYIGKGEFTVEFAHSIIDPLNKTPFLSRTFAFNSAIGRDFVEIAQPRAEFDVPVGSQGGIEIRLSDFEINKVSFFPKNQTLSLRLVLDGKTEKECRFGQENVPSAVTVTLPMLPTGHHSIGVSARANLSNVRSATTTLSLSGRASLTVIPCRLTNDIPDTILKPKEASSYIVTPCDNNIKALRVSKDAYQNAANPDAVEAAIKSGLADIEMLMKPVFYQDNVHTLFVEPSVTERTIEEWQDWVTSSPQPELGLPEWLDPDWLEKHVRPGIPIPKPPISDPRDPGIPPIDPGSLIKPMLDFDWLVNPDTVLEFGGVLIGPAGQPGLKILPSGSIAEAATPVNVNPGSGLASGSIVVLTGTTTLEQTGLTQVAGGLKIIGSAGFNSALTQNFNESNRSGFGAGRSGTGRLGR